MMEPVDYLRKSLELLEKAVRSKKVTPRQAGLEDAEGNPRKKRFTVTDRMSELHRAADQRRKVVLRYSKRGNKRGGGEYLVAPYSIRDRGGSSYLYAYDFKERRTKSFKIDNITGVLVTPKRFNPKWNVELSDG